MATKSDPRHRPSYIWEVEIIDGDKRPEKWAMSRREIFPFMHAYTSSLQGYVGAKFTRNKIGVGLTSDDGMVVLRVYHNGKLATANSLDAEQKLQRK